MWQWFNRWIGQLGWILCCCALIALSAAKAHADEYTLVAGDVVWLKHPGLEEPAELTIDINGQIRLVGFGAIPLQGLTLNGAEGAVRQIIDAADMFVEPRVDIALKSYAPLVVAGDVTSPGQIAFVPGMTVETAIAIAGGIQHSGRLRSDVLHLRAELQGRLRDATIDILTQEIEIARLMATLKQAETIDFAELKTSGMAIVATDMTELLSAAERLFYADQERMRRLQSHWDQEIDAIESQQRLFAERIELGEEMARVAQTELEIARDLQAKGLQTSARMATVELRDADARSDVLALQSAQVVAATSLAEARLERDRFLTDREQALLSRLSLAHKQLLIAKSELGRVQDQLGHLNAYGLASDSPTFDVDIRIMSARSGVSSVSRSAPVLPGETIVVDLHPIQITALE